MDILIIGLFFGIPIASIAFFVSSLINYLNAKKDGAEPQELKKRKLLLILSIVIALALVAAVVGVIVLLMMAIAYM